MVGGGGSNSNQGEGRKEGLGDFLTFSPGLLSYSGTFLRCKDISKGGCWVGLDFMKNLGFRVYNQNGFSSGSSFHSTKKWNLRSG